MKVIQVNAVNGVGSTGRNVSELAMGLASRGVECRIAYSTGTEPDHGYRIGSGFEKLVHSFASRLSGRQAYFSRRGTRGLLAYLLEESPDVVHLQNLHSNFINLPMLLEFLAREDIATVLTLHDCWFFTGKCCHYVGDGCYRWRSTCGSCPRLSLDNPSWFLDRTAQLLADKRRLFGAIPRLGVVGVSRWITGEAQASILAGAEAMVTIGNWVDLNIFKPREAAPLKRSLGWDNRFVMLAVASTWSDAKGLSDLIRLGRALDQGALDTESKGRPKLVLLGKIPSRVALPASVEHIHETSDMPTLSSYYSAADVVLQLSREETFGKVTAEALASGTPVLACDTTANPELVAEGCGYLVQPGDDEETLERLRDVVSSDVSSVSRECRRFAEARFDMEARIDDHVAFYRRLCLMQA